MRFTQGAGSDSESEPDPLDEDEDGMMIYTAKQAGHEHGHYGATFRSRIFPRHSKGITTAPGQLGAGETETEADEPVRKPISLHVPDRILTRFMGYLAEASTHSADRTSFRSTRTAKHSRASHHATLI